ncbi:MAG TPA: chemotaxis protein CheA [Chloroflexota bacterium]|nr:chemotaxis protein CheA [Chloroflexota bacterium]
MAQMQFDATEDDIKVWLAEADEQIELLQNDVIRLEKDYSDESLVQGIFRAAHTLKGSSAMIGHTRMAELTHAMESVFGMVREGKLTPTTEIVDSLLAGVDGLNALREEVVTKEQSDVDLSPSVAALRDIVEQGGGTFARMPGQPPAAGGQEPGAGGQAGPAPTTGSLLERFPLEPDEIEAVKATLESGAMVWLLEVDFQPDSLWLAVRSFQSLNDLSNVGELLKTKPTSEEVEAEKVGPKLQAVIAGAAEAAEAITNTAAVIEDVVNTSLTPYTLESLSPSPAAAGEGRGEGAQGEDHPHPSPLPPAGEGTELIPSQTKPPAEAGQRVATASRVVQNVRVDVERLDNLMNLVGELVIDRNRLQQLALQLETELGAHDAVDALNETSQHVGRITDELQEEVMRIRMQPIESVFNKFPRLVRDLAGKLGKKVDFIIEGKETELDRSVIEKIDDPIIHLLRNAIDHGLEMPEERRAAGKPETGTIKLSAWHEENHIVIAVQDDGRGMDPAKLKASAVSKKIITQEVADRMDDRAAVELIFAAGFSTAAKTTDVSGRGVGMDIVRANIEKLSGFVTIETAVGRGTRFLVKLPLTLAIIRALLVALAGRKFAIPMATVMETLRFDAQDVRTIKTHEAIQLRGRILPLVSLRDLLRLPALLYPAPGEPASASPEDEDGDAASNGASQGMRDVGDAEGDSMMEMGNRPRRQKMFVVAVRVGDRQMGLQVDALVGETEIVIKPLSRFLGDVRGIAGVTILGDGQVAIICDIPSLINRVVQEQLLA